MDKYEKVTLLSQDSLYILRPLQTRCTGDGSLSGHPVARLKHVVRTTNEPVQKVASGSVSRVR